MEQQEILREHLEDHATAYIDPRTTLLSGSYENIREILEEDLDDRTIDVFAMIARLSNYGERRVIGSEIFTNENLEGIGDTVIANALTTLSGLNLIDVHLGNGEALSAPAAYEFFQRMPVTPAFWNVGLPEVIRLFP
ncbi:hypothetical protein KQI65_15980 [bacterium]|nr:hypothetical protein [bacterium]